MRRGMGHGTCTQKQSEILRIEPGYSTRGGQNTALHASRKTKLPSYKLWRFLRTSGTATPAFATLKSAALHYPDDATKALRLWLNNTTCFAADEKLRRPVRPRAFCEGGVRTRRGVTGGPVARCAYATLVSTCQWASGCRDSQCAQCLTGYPLFPGDAPGPRRAVARAPQLWAQLLERRIVLGGRPAGTGRATRRAEKDSHRTRERNSGARLVERAASGRRGGGSTRFFRHALFVALILDLP